MMEVHGTEDKTSKMDTCNEIWKFFSLYLRD